MTPERWKDITRIYAAVVATPAHERTTVLSALTPDAAIRREVESLLASDPGGSLLDRASSDHPSVLGVLEPVHVGSSIGVFRIDALLGVGGMGEVYRATDTRLQRTVAIKVLPRVLAEDTQFRARFDREAKSIAALNHPHICTLHDVGRDGAVSYLVMEFLEGETLASRLARGAIPFEQALTYAVEIADALATAHRAGIIHRDLKPGNVMVTRTGTKLLDFGLAKVGAGASLTSSSMLPTTPPGATGRRGMPLTARGTILGTLQYMAPEQLEGREADARTDIFAFGALLYELMTGTRAFQGSTQASLIAAIMTGSPASMTPLQPLTPAGVERLVRTCLAKHPDDRWQSIRDVARELRELPHSPLPAVATGGARRRSARPTLLVMTSVIAGVLTGGIAVASWLASRPASLLSSGPAIRFSIALPPVGNQPGGFGNTPGNSVGVVVPPLTVSPDGRWIVFAAADEAHRNVFWIRGSDGESRPLPDTANARHPFWSPDSRMLAFFTQRDLMAMEVAGGPPRRLFSAMFENGVGGAWATDGTVFAAKDDGVWRLSRDKQPVRILSSDRDNEWRFPQTLEDGSRLLVWNREQSAVFAVRPDGSDPRRILDLDRSPAYRVGWFVFSRGQNVFAQAFDARTLSLTGHPRSLPVRVQSSASGYLPLWLSDNGVLVSSMGERISAQLTWLDRKGMTLGTVGDAVNQGNLITTSDESRIATTRTDASDNNITVVIDRRRGDLVTPVGEGGNPLFSPNGSQVAMWVTYGGGLVVRSLDGSPPKIVYPGIAWPTDWSADGRTLVVQTPDLGHGMDVALLDLVSGQLSPLVATPANEANGRLAPGHKWVAYVSDRSSRGEVYLTSLDDAARTIPVSSDGGYSPRWRADGKELFFQTLDGLSIMSVQVTWNGNEPTASRPVQLLRTGELSASSARNPLFGNSYYPSADGTRFLVARVAKHPPGSIDVLVNWQKALSE